MNWIEFKVIAGLILIVFGIVGLIGLAVDKDKCIKDFKKKGTNK